MGHCLSGTIKAKTHIRTTSEATTDGGDKRTLDPFKAQWGGEVAAAKAYPISSTTNHNDLYNAPAA